MKRTIVCISLLLMVAMPSRLLGWGPEGHEIIARLAEARLSDKARNDIRPLIGGVDLAAIANWADEVRPQRDETYNWHFVDIPKDAPGFSDERDCFLPNSRHQGAASDHHNCVVDRIKIFDRVLAEEKSPREERIEALKFLVHFVGDVHQPMHAIGEAAGGNGIAVKEFGSTECGRHSCNLHGAWDTGLIRHTGLGVEEYATRLTKRIEEEHLQASGTPEDWANESHRFAQRAWLENGAEINEEYYRQEIGVLDDRLALAGLRLAALLNQAFGGQP